MEVPQGQLRHGRMVSWAVLGTVCALLDCQPGDLLEYVPDDPAAPAGATDTPTE